jgi:hypothetical protein
VELGGAATVPRRPAPIRPAAPYHINFFVLRTYIGAGSAYGTRTRAPALRGPCPNRLDERAEWKEYRSSRSSGVQVEFGEAVSQKASCLPCAVPLAAGTDTPRPSDEEEFEQELREETEESHVVGGTRSVGRGSRVTWTVSQSRIRCTTNTSSYANTLADV